MPTEFLLNEAIVSQYGAGRREWADREIELLVHKYSVSREVIVRRLLTARRTTDAFYKSKRKEYHEQLAIAESGDNEGGFESPTSKAVNLNGPAFTRLVLESYHTGRINLNSVSNYLGVRLKHLAKIEQSVLAP